MFTANTDPCEIAPSREQVLEAVRQIVSEFSNVAPEMIRESDHLENDLGCDSLDLVEITMEVEEHFNLTVPDDMDRETATVRGIVDGVLRLLAAPHA